MMRQEKTGKIARCSAIQSCPDVSFVWPLCEVANHFVFEHQLYCVLANQNQSFRLCRCHGNLPSASEHTTAICAKVTRF